MPDTTDSTQSLLTRRKLTRAIAESSRAQLVEYLTTLTPLLQPEAVLGEHVQGGRREASRKPAEALINEAERFGARMIVVGNRRMRGIGRVLGSVANSVAHNAPCDVYIAKTDVAD